MTSMNDAINFLHNLHQQIIEDYQDPDTIVRFEIDKDVKPENVHLIIVCKGCVQPIRIDPEDEMNQVLIDFSKQVLGDGIASLTDRKAVCEVNHD